MHRINRSALLVLVAGSAGLAIAQVQSEPAVEGIPVADPLVIARCSGCHKKDDKGNLTRISWIRTTPEGWQEAIKRMVRLNGAQLTPEDARNIVKSLSASHGLAPEEAKPVMYMAEHRIIDETFPTPTIRSTCASCHPLGRPAQWRRTKEEWQLLVNMHLGYFPDSEGAAFRRFGPPTAEPQPAEQAVDFLSKTYPLSTPEWSAWQARMRPPRLAGGHTMNSVST
jgi:quinohemoprotein amine dehydrogenase